MKQLIKLGLLSLLLTLTVQLNAQTLRYTSTMTSTPTTTIGVGENRTTFVAAPGNDITLVDMVTLGINHNYTEFIADDFALEVDVLVTPAGATAFTITLEIDYKSFKRQDYRDQDTYVFYNSNDYTYQISAIRVDGVTATSLPKNVFLTGEIDSRRIVPFAGAAVTAQPKQLSNVDGCDGDDEITINWSTVPGGIEYQLEWTFVNNYDATVTASGSAPNVISATNLNYDFRGNSTRVTTTSTTYTIPLLFEKGHLLFRVRAIGMDANQNWVVGNWNTLPAGTVDSYISANPNLSYQVLTAHEQAKNWQVTTTFAEEGKKKEVISYYDGSLRNRQSVTKVNTDNNVIVGETIYDHQGRPAVNILPVPVVEPTCSTYTNQAVIKHYPDFNKNTGGDGYNRADFDVDVADCETATGIMNSVSGASLYYSPNNPNQAYEQGYVPNAENYPFTVVEYTPDNTGRIRRQSGVGPEFQLGSGHESKYFYGKPDQIQIDRLFGSEVGYHEHYKKNMVIDPNGQVSVSYLDQEGRVIATSLAGEAPGNLTPIESFSTAQVDLEQQMILPNENTVTPAPFNNVNKMVFSEVLLVSSAGTYDFDYDMSADVFSEACLPNICFHCIYDLKIELTDDCHVPVTGNNITDGTINTPIVIEVLQGHYEVNGNNEIVFSTDCADGDYAKEYKFSAFLPVGNYNLHKTLTINEEAINYYLTQYLDPVNNTCVETLEDFQDAYLAEIDTMDCYIDCEACVADLGNRDDFVADGRGSAQDYDDLLEACEAPCKSPTMCEIAYEMILADVSPGGQYGEYLNASGAVSVGQFPVSVFNTSNGLPQVNADWRNPFTPYADEQGNEVKIPVVEISSGVYSPALIAGIGTGLTEATPQLLASVEVFIDEYWQASFAKSLINYHPEYCYYETCLTFEEEDEDGNSSEKFDAKLRTMTFTQGVTAGILVGNNTTGYDVNFSSDPLFVNNLGSSVYTTLGAELQTALDNYLSLGGTMYDFSEIAAATANCGPQLVGATTLTPSCILLGADVAGNTAAQNDALRNNGWNTVVALYLSKKTEIINNYADQQAISSNCFNDCIGNDDFNPFAKGFFTTNGAFVFSNNPYYSPLQPCGAGNRFLFLNKQKRFPDPTDLTYDPNEVAYNLYQQSGQCPVAMNFQTLLNQIAATNNLLVDIPNLENFTSYAGLAFALNGNNLSQPFNSTQTDANVDGTNVLTLKIIDNPANYSCVTTLKSISPTVINWNEVVGFTGLSATQFNGIEYEFNVTAKLEDALGALYYIPLKGTTCLNILDCNFAQACEPNQLALDLGVLFTTMATAGDFNSTFAIGANPNYVPLLTPLISSYFSTTSGINWTLNLASREAKLFEGSKTLYITFEPFNLAGNAPFNTVKMFANINSAHQNQFTVDAQGATGNLLAALTGNVVYSDGTTTTPVSMGTCGDPTDLSCNEAGHHNFEDLEALLTDELLQDPFDANINLYANPLLTAQLKSYFSLSQTATTGIMITNLDGGIYTTRLTIKNGACDLVLEVETPINVDFGDLSNILNFNVAGTSSQGNFYEFTASGVFTTNLGSNTYTIKGSSCIPLKKCEECEPPKTPAQKLAVLESEFKVKSDSTVVKYEALVMVIDTLNTQLGFDTADVRYVTPPSLATSIENNYQAFFSNYERYLKNYNPAVDDSSYLYNIDQFIADYGSCINVDKEYVRYAATVQLYNQRAVLASVDTLITVDRDFYIDNNMACHCNKYVNHIDTCLNGNTTEALQAVDFFTQHNFMDTTAVLDSNGLAYQAYANAYRTFEAQNPQFEVCSQYVKFASYTDVAQLNYFEDSLSRAELLTYAASLTDTTTPAEPLTIARSGFPNPVPAPYAAPIETNAELTCAQLYAVYEDMIAQYNASAYALLNNHQLSVIPFREVEKLCSCLPAFFNYLAPYLVTPPNSNLPIPFNVTNFGCGRVINECDQLYSQYVTAIANYNQFVTEKGKPWSTIKNIIKPDAFSAQQLCNCVEGYLAFLELQISGLVDTAPTADQLNLLTYCAEEPCTPETPVMLDTIPVVIVPYVNPCVENMINVALANAANAYQQYIDNLSTEFITNYKNHCVNSLNESFVKKYTQREHHFTLYYYDQAGNLVKTVPPEGVQFVDITKSSDPLAIKIQQDRMNQTQTVFSNHRLETKYMYNSLNQLTKQTLPDHDQMDVWNLTLPNGLDSKLHIEDVQYISANKGYLVGWIPMTVNSATVNRGVMYTTNNGGNNWSKVNDIVASDIQALQWTNNNQAFAVGTGGVLLRTENGGGSWDMVNLYEDNVTEQLNDLYLNAGGIGLLVGNNLTLVDYQNGLVNYATKITPVSTNAAFPFSANDHIKSIAYNSATAEYVIAVNKANGTSMQYTSTDKINWTPLHQLKAENLNTLSVVDAQTAFVAGDNGLLLKTTDGGTNWIVTETEIRDAIEHVYFRDALQGVAIIDQHLYKTTDGGKTWSLLDDSRNYNSLEVYENSATQSKLLAGCDFATLVKVIVKDGQPFGFIPYEVSSSNLASPITHVYASKNGSQVAVIALTNSNQLHYCPNLDAAAPSWTATTVGLGSLNQIRFKHTGAGNNLIGMLLDQNNKLYGFELGSSFTTTPLNLSVDFADLAIDNAGNGVAYGYSNNSITTVNLTPGNITSTSQTVGATTNTSDAQLAIDLTGKTWLVNGAGNINQLAPSTYALADQTNHVRAEWINDVVRTTTATVAITKNGKVINTLGINGTLKIAPTTNDLNAAVTLGGVTGIVGDGGLVYNFNGSAFTVAPAFTSDNLTSIALQPGGTQLMIGSEQGNIWYVANVTSPTYTLVPNNEPNAINALSLNAAGMSLAGANHSHIHFGMGSNITQAKNIYPNKLHGVDYLNETNGTVVGDGYFVRTTNDASTTFDINLPISGFTAVVPMELRGVKTLTNGSIVTGALNYIAKATNQNVDAPILSSSGLVIYDVNIIDNTGYAVGGQAGAGVVYKTVNNGGAWTSLSGAGTEPLYGMHMFENNKTVITVGAQKTILYHNGTGGMGIINNNTVGSLPTEDYKDVAFYDNQLGYIVGANGTFLRSFGHDWNNGSDLLFTELNWEEKNLTDDVTTQPTNGTKNINAVAFADRYHAFIGGDYAANSRYARVLNDESGEFSTYFFYDKLGRIVVSQNSRQYNETPQKYSYTLYDFLGRVEEAGEKTSPSSLSGQTDFNSIFGTTVSGVFNPKVIDDAKLVAWINGTGARNEVTHSYYDKPVVAIAAQLPVTFTQNQDNLRKRIGMVTFESTYDGNDATYDYATHYDYDIHGNVKTVLQDNQKLSTISSIADNRFKRMDYTYDLISGNVHKVSYQKGAPDAWHHRYEYDGDNRIKIVETSDNDLRWQRDVTYHYYDHGPLARVELGENNVQGVDYAYTLQGWLKGVNSDLLNPLNDIGKDGATTANNPNQNFARDAFGFALHYYTDDYKAITPGNNVTAAAFNSDITGSDLAANKNDLHNGNIGAMVTTIKKPLLYSPDPNITPEILPQGTAYQYDQLNRLLQARAFVNLDNATNQWQAAGTYDERYFNAFTYDANGNIASQVRKDQAGATIDQLTYNYAEVGTHKVQNRLYSVDDVVNYDAEDIDDMPLFISAFDNIDDENYVYDATGQLIQDKQEGIADIVWRVDGKIKGIIRFPGSAKTNITFDYDPMGQRIAKHVYGNQSNTLATPFDINNPTDWQSSTYYNRDAQGNVMAIYEHKVEIVETAQPQLIADINGTAIPDWQLQNNLIAASPLSEATLIALVNSNRPEWVISAVLNVNDPLSYPVLLALAKSDLEGYLVRDFLVAASPLCDDVLIALLRNTFPTWVKNEVLNVNPDFSDAVALVLLQESNMTQGEIYTQLNNNNPWSDAVLNTFLDACPPFVAYQIEGLLLANSDLTDDVLLNLLDGTPTVPSYVINSVMTANTPFSNQVYQALIAYTPTLPSWMITSLTNNNGGNGTGFTNPIESELARVSSCPAGPVNSAGTNGIVKFTLAERNIYGSSRVGMNINEVEMISYASNDPHLYNYIGKRQYELSNHLGNVLTVVSDRKFARDIDQNGEVDYFEPDILLTYDYSPFGVILKERAFVKDVCRDTSYLQMIFDLENNFEALSLDGWAAVGTNVSVTNSCSALTVTKNSNTAPYPQAEKIVSLVSGITYAFKYNLLSTNYNGNRRIVADVIDMTTNAVVGTSGQFTATGLDSIVFTATTTGNYKLVFRGLRTSGNFNQMSGYYFTVDDIKVTHIAEVDDLICVEYNNYRYGFQGQEKDDEIKGEGNSVNYTYRMHDTRLGRFFAVDPLTTDYPHMTPYQFAGNKPIWSREIEGLESEIDDLRKTGTDVAGSVSAGYNVSAEVSVVGTYQKIGENTKFFTQFGATANSTLRMNGVYTLGTQSTTNFGNIGAGISLGSTTITLDYTFTYRNYSGSSKIANEYTNSTGRYRLGITGKENNTFSIAWENDGDLNTHIENYYDGGFTNSFQFNYYHSGSENLFTLRLDMYTPQRPGGPNGNGTGNFQHGGFNTVPGSLWSNGGLGFYDTEGDSRTGGMYSAPTTLSMTTPLKNGTSTTITIGVDSHFIGSFIQGKVHQAVKVPEFKWDPTINFPIAGIKITF